MNVFSDLLQGFDTVLSPENLLFAALGATLGTLIGVLPGIGPALTIALLLPLTFSMNDPTGAFIMFAGIYAGAMYGGSTTSILVNTPGESASVATAIEGYQMARRGRARTALATAAIGSFVAGTISIVLLTFVAEPVASVAVKFRASDYFALAILAMVSVTALVGRSLVRGLMSLFLGLFLGLVGIDQLTGQDRFAFGRLELLDGVDIVIVIVGLFAIGETLYVASRPGRIPEHVASLEPAKGRFGWLSREDWRRSFMPWIRGAGIGFPFGALPAGKRPKGCLPVSNSLATQAREYTATRSIGSASPSSSPTRCRLDLSLIARATPTSREPMVLVRVDGHPVGSRLSVMTSACERGTTTWPAG